MLEAMACGTPVLATPVGAIPDVIIDGETGFIMADNSRDSISENVLRLLRSSEPNRVSAASPGEHVRERYDASRTVSRWQQILQPEGKP